MTTKIAQLGEKMKNKKHVYVVEREYWDEYNIITGTEVMVFFKEEEAFNFVKNLERDFTERIFNGKYDKGEEEHYTIRKFFEDQTDEYLYSNRLDEKECFEQFVKMI